MRRKIRRLKKLFLTVSESDAINWILFFMIIISAIFNLATKNTYIFLSIVLSLEVLFLVANDVNKPKF